MEVARKITVAMLGDAKAARKLDNGAEIYLGRIAGIAGGLKGYTTPNGDAANGLKGRFMAINAAGAVIAQGPVAYLPKAANEAVEGALMSGSETVEFAFEIYSVSDESSQTGYVYRTVSLIEPAANDPLMKLAASLPEPNAQAALALPSPATDDKPAKGAKATKA